MKETPNLTPAQRIRAEAKQASKKALLAAGLAETVEHGGVVPNIDSICARAGYTRGAFYVYFKSRGDFVVQLLDWVTGDIFQAIFRDAAENGTDLRGVVTRFTQALAKREWPDVTDIRSAYMSVIAGLRESDAVRQRHANLMTAAEAQIATAIRNEQDAGRVQASRDPDHVARITLLVAIGLIVWDDVGMPIDPVAIGEHLLALIEEPSFD
ncbi:MAG TPA: TetR/AcrR family transcriptional regulator [Actinomycetota bacterium]